MTAWYLCARYSRRHEMERYAALLRAQGHTVASTWHDGHHEVRPDVERDATPEEEAAWATEDLHDLAASEGILAFTEAPGHPGRNRGGRHVEFGYAIGGRLLVVVVGPVEHVFHRLAAFRFDDMEGVLAWLRDTDR